MQLRLGRGNVWIRTSICKYISYTSYTGIYMSYENNDRSSPHKWNWKAYTCIGKPQCLQNILHNRKLKNPIISVYFHQHGLYLRVIFVNIHKTVEHFQLVIDFLLTALIKVKQDPLQHNNFSKFNLTNWNHDVYNVYMCN